MTAHLDWGKRLTGCGVAVWSRRWGGSIRWTTGRTSNDNVPAFRLPALCILQNLLDVIIETPSKLLADPADFVNNGILPHVQTKYRLPRAHPAIALPRKVGEKHSVNHLLPCQAQKRHPDNFRNGEQRKENEPDEVRPH